MRFKRVPFGFKASMFLLTAVIVYHLGKVGGSFAERIKGNFYVDNVFGGETSIEGLRRYYKASKGVFNEAGMNLREWASNCSEFIAELPRKDQANGRFQKVLGIIWDTSDDLFYVPGSEDPKCSVVGTKRQLLRAFSKIFDPLGYFSPVVLQARLLLQQVAKRKTQWDEDLDGHERASWSNIQKDIVGISKVPVVRYLGPGGDVKYELHCFTDASERAYACCVYLRRLSGGIVHTDLVFAKSRVGPLQRVTIPRMELLGVLIGVRSLQFVQRELRVHLDRIVLWSDSKCVLRWYSGKKQQPVFIENRLSEIRAAVGIIFSYIRSEDNPSDIATKGTSLATLVEHKLWWHGPHWLSHAQYLCEPFQCVDQDDESDLEPASAAVLGSGDVGSLQSPPARAFPCDRFSSWLRFLRVVVIVIRQCNRFLGRFPGSTLIQGFELSQAETRVLIEDQEHHFQGLKLALRQNRMHILIKQLGCRLSTDGLIRCHGRLQNSCLEECAITPILLSPMSKMTRLIVDHEHRRLMHSGVAHTLGVLRSRFWIPQGRAAVHKAVRDCRVCRKAEGRAYGAPPAPPLPGLRVVPSRPFACVGLDFFGPVTVKEKEPDRQQKAWVCLFTCAVVRAVHLELVSDMSTGEFLLAFKRFVARRGVPQTVISDNAKQFKAAKAFFSVAWEDLYEDPEVSSYLSAHRIDWKFIVEKAPFMGGFYERLVGTVKRALRKSIGRLLLSFSQMNTVLVEAEAVVNSRPLVYVGGEFEGKSPLTPGHFLSVGSQNGFPAVCHDEDPTYERRGMAQSLSEMWIKGQRHMDSFWRAWQKEYLLNLREKWNIKDGSRIQPSVGDIVVLSEALPRGSWKLAKVVELCRSADGLVRSVKLRMASGKIKRRSTTQVHPIEFGTLQRAQEEAKGQVESNVESLGGRSTRKAALEAKEKIKNMVQ